MKKIILLCAAFIATPVHAATNADVGIQSMELADMAKKMCIAMMEANPPHRAQWFRANTKTAQEAFFAMALCDSYILGRNDGRMAERERQK